MLDSCKIVENLSEAFNTFLWHFLHIILLKCPYVQIAFFKFTSCDEQALVGCIPIAAVVIHLKLKS